ncbi:MAG: hypothetical protein Q9222_006648 [Ikaeria aurantiellina]
MDSMKSLNKSLPRASKSSAAQPPEQLLQAFKTAALSVTNLYKTAASDQTRARQAGYQEALDDVLAFLDKHNLGLGDGEGWKVRQWATEHLDENIARAMVSDSDDETEKRARSHSPVLQHKSSAEVLSAATQQQQQQQHVGSTSPVRNMSAPPIPQQNPLQTIPMSNPAPTSIPPPPPATEIFSFRSSHPYPHDIDMIPSEPLSTTSNNPQTAIPVAPPPPPPAVRLEVLPRGPKTPHRHSSNPNKHNTRGANILNRRSLGTGAGSKRRFDVNDYFDLGNLGEGKDGMGGGGGGGKKGRLG